MTLFKPRLPVTIDNIIANKNGRFIVIEAIFDETKIVFVNIYAPNDQTHQVQFLRDLSHSTLNQYANEKVVLGGDLDNCGGHSFEYKRTIINEMNTLLTTCDLVDMWRQKNPNLPGYTWSNPSMKI